MSEPFSENPVHLTDDEALALQAWIDTAKARLALTDWTIIISPHQCEGDALASSHIRDYADIAIVALSAGWRDWSPEELRLNLTHELLHPHFQRVTVMAMRLIEKELGARTEAVIDQAVRIVEEQSIERLASAVSKWLPLPGHPDKKDRFTIG